MQDELAELWVSRPRRFPDLSGKFEVSGVCLVSLDTNIAGCLSSYMKPTNEIKRLDLQRFQVLQRSIDELEKVLPHLKSEVREYFIHMRELAALVLKEAEIA